MCNNFKDPKTGEETNVMNYRSKFVDGEIRYFDNKWKPLVNEHGDFLVKIGRLSKFDPRTSSMKL